MEYDKPPFTNEQHIQLLKSRGLIIPDESRAMRYLSTVGYYRLTGYMYHLQKNNGNHSFFENTNFDEIILHYQFDKKLRALVLEYLERIEVALRAKLTNKFSINHGFFWYANQSLYSNNDIYNQIISEVKEKFDNPQEWFLKKFKLTYSNDFPPSNMAMEILSLGKLSRLYKGLSDGDEKKAIAKDFGLPSNIVESWFIYLTNVRNVCAHHSRLWNKRITADRPMIPARKIYRFNGKQSDDFNTTMYGIVSIIYRLLIEINPNNSFIIKLTNLFNEYPSINTSSMGFSSDWKSNPAWKKNEDNILHSNVGEKSASKDTQ